MTQFIKINKEDSELMHFGILGMHWGKRKAGTGEPSTRSAKKASKLSDKYNTKVGEGISEREVKGAVKQTQLVKEQAKQTVIEKFNNETLGYFTDIKGKPMSEAAYKRAVDKTNVILAEIDKTRLSSISEEKSASGKRYIDLKLGNKR